MPNALDEPDEAHPTEQGPEPERPAMPAKPATPSIQTEALPPERLSRARAVYRHYYRWLRLSRLTMGAFIVMAAIFLIWLTPWLPSGLDTDDYTPELAFTVYLLGGVSITGMLALAFQELARRDREALMVWATVYDETTGLHNRTYLYDRLSLECERAERSGVVFSLIVLQLRIDGSRSKRGHPLPKDALQQIAELIGRLTHPSDLVALLSGSELAILATGVDRAARRPLQERIRSAVAAELRRLLDEPTAIDVKAGAATYGTDGNDAGTLVQAARTAAMLALPKRGRAAA